jgi:two-component system nitrogen regulation response regulator GlnG
MIAAGQFRGDLYYRLNVCSIQLPPLRQRGDDLRLLAAHYLRRFGRELGKVMDGLADEALELLRRYGWPGNVRELQSVLKQAILLSAGPVLLPEFLPPALRGEAPASARTDAPVRESTSPAQVPEQVLFPGLAQFIQSRLEAGSTQLYAEVQALAERQLFLHVLRHTGNNLTQSARVLGIGRATLRTRLAALGLSVERSTSLEDEQAG